MSITTGLRSHLLADSDVTAIVGTEIYMVYLAQDFTLPAISIRKIEAPRVHTLSGPTGRVKAEFDVDLFAAAYSVVENLANEVRKALDGFDGTLGTEVNVGGIHLIDEVDFYDDNVEVLGITQTYIVNYFD